MTQTSRRSMCFSALLCNVIAQKRSCFRSKFQQWQVPRGHCEDTQPKKCHWKVAGAAWGHHKQHKMVHTRGSLIDRMKHSRLPQLMLFSNFHQVFGPVMRQRRLGKTTMWMSDPNNKSTHNRHRENQLHLAAKPLCFPFQFSKGANVQTCRKHANVGVCEWFCVRPLLPSDKILHHLSVVEGHASSFCSAWFFCSCSGCCDLCKPQRAFGPC